MRGKGVFARGVWRARVPSASCTIMPKLPSSSSHVASARVHHRHVGQPGCQPCQDPLGTPACYDSRSGPEEDERSGSLRVPSLRTTTAAARPSRKATPGCAAGCAPAIASPDTPLSVNGTPTNLHRTSVWHREPDGRWVFWQRQQDDQSCLRYFSGAVGESRRADIELGWPDDATLRVAIPDVDLVWTARLAATAVTRVLNAVGRAMTDRTWLARPVPTAIGPIAGFALRRARSA
jgi:hypothetical protein